MGESGRSAQRENKTRRRKTPSPPNVSVGGTARQTSFRFLYSCMPVFIFIRMWKSGERIKTKVYAWVAAERENTCVLEVTRKLTRAALYISSIHYLQDTPTVHYTLSKVRKYCVWVRSGVYLFLRSSCTSHFFWQQVRCKEVCLATSTFRLNNKYMDKDTTELRIQDRSKSPLLCVAGLGEGLIHGALLHNIHELVVGDLAVLVAVKLVDHGLQLLLAEVLA